MCSPCDCGENSQSHVPLDGLTISELKSCRRCGAEPFVTIDKVRIECKQCFLEFCNRKFRTTIGKSKLVKNNDCILLAYSGGPNSTALLDLIYNSMRCETRREQKFRVKVLHIDTSIIQLKEETETDQDFLCQRVDNLTKRLETLSRTYPDWPIYFTNIEQYFSGNNNSRQNNEQESDSINYIQYDTSVDENFIKSQLNNDSHQNALREALEELPDLTERQRFLDRCCFSLLDRVVNQINSSCNQENDKLKYIVTGSCATQLANDLLVDVILGQGSSIGSAVSICDRRTQVPLMRPLREFNMKEIAFYLKAREIHTHVSVTPNLLTYRDRKASIQNVTEAFLSKLFLDYPSTYSTLLRTGSKMTE